MKTIGEMMSINKLKALSEIQSWATQDGFEFGYWVTLDTVSFGEWTPDRIEFEQKIAKFANRLNSYCYGRSYRRNKKRLKIVGAIEIGQFMNRNHAHLLIMHDEQMKREYADVDEKIRQYWYSLIGARGSSTGNLVDVQPIGDVHSRLQYALKHLHARLDKYSSVVMQ